MEFKGIVMKWNQTGLMAVAVAALVLQGCSAPVREGDMQDIPVDERSVGVDPGSDGRPGVETGVVQVGEGFFDGRPIEEVMQDPESVLSKRVFYFEFDSAELPLDEQAALEVHARFLASNPRISVVLEGHTDERGSREYNLALGERRAKSIERLLSLLGVGQGQMEVISFGEERPVALGQHEDAWRLNRRVELLYTGY